MTEREPIRRVSRAIEIVKGLGKMVTREEKSPETQGQKDIERGGSSGELCPRGEETVLLPMGIPRLLTVKEAAAALRMSRNGVMNLIARGQLPSVQVPGGGLTRPAHVLIDKDDLCEYIGKWKQGDGKSVTVL